MSSTLVQRLRPPAAESSLTLSKTPNPHKTLALESQIPDPAPWTTTLATAPLAAGQRGRSLRRRRRRRRRGRRRGKGRPPLRRRRWPRPRRAASSSRVSPGLARNLPTLCFFRGIGSCFSALWFDDSCGGVFPPFSRCCAAESPAEFFAENKNIAGFDNVSYISC